MTAATRAYHYSYCLTFVRVYYYMICAINHEKIEMTVNQCLPCCLLLLFITTVAMATAARTNAHHRYDKLEIVEPAARSQM